MSMGKICWCVAIKLHSITSRKAALSVITAVKTSDLTQKLQVCVF